MQILGAITKRKIWLLLFAIPSILFALILYWSLNVVEHPRCPVLWMKILGLFSFTFLISVIISACNVLTDTFSLRREESRITNCQIAILCAVGVWIIGVVFLFNIQKEDTSYAALALIGSVLAWIFKDKIVGAVTFIHFRMHGLLNIGDWIQVPKLGVDGEVKKVTLTTVTLSNWDTTISTIPINALQSEHFINLHNMVKGKTYGRRMLAEYIIDTGWIHPIDEKEVKSFLSGKHQIMDYLPEDELTEGTLNIHLYRLYLYHWLMENSHVSQRPRLLVRWQDQKETGMVLQVYAFLTDHELPAFEWQKSLIIEHIIASMAWFGLRLYQSPSAYDASNSNIYMTKAPATYKIEEK